MTRIAILSDIHGNRTAFEAVAADIRSTAPDLVLHGGDLADGGSAPTTIVDRIRELGWQGIAGNTDEMLFRPESLTAFASRSPHLHALFQAVEEMAAATREALGEERLAWLQTLPQTRSADAILLLHATPASLWLAPGPEASDADLESTYGPMRTKLVVYAHIHRPYIRKLPGMTIVNTGSVGLPYDGDRRASYLLLDGNENGYEALIRRVEYHVDEEIRAVEASGLPHAAWIARTLASAQPQMP
jgi:putative phosphoesterase